jgi:hypothetical protein
MSSPFAQWEELAWPYKFRCTLRLNSVAGGCPSDPATAEGWIRSKIQGKEERIQQMIAEAIAERGLSPDEAAEEVNRRKHLNGFKRDEMGGLFIEGRHVKAALKEAASVAAASGKVKLQKWGHTNKYILGFMAEHVFVTTDRIYLGRDEADNVAQSFPENKKIGQRGIQLTEYCENVDISFEVVADWEFTEKDWAMFWLTGEMEGLGACRSQGFGRYKVTEWERIKA